MTSIIDEIKKFEKFGSKLGLERMNELLSRLGNPENDLQVIHVAGTNGKGSVSCFISEILRANGYNVGLFISPFVEDFNERIQVNGEKISNADLDKHYSSVLEKVDEMIASGFESPTEFELVTAIAFLYFAEKKLDFIVLEVGLGGLGDSTNVIKKPLLTIITSISYDHMDRLGDTIEEIAVQKAGIIKSGCTLVSGVEDEEAKKVIAKIAYEKNAPMVDASKFKPLNIERGRECYRFGLEINSKLYLDLEITMLGDHQLKNAITALTAIDVLRTLKKIRVEREKLLQGLARAKQAGRFEKIGKFLLDGAHNRAGADALFDTVSQLYPDAKILTLIGVMKDKDAEYIINKFSEFTDYFIVTRPASESESAVSILSSYIKDKDIGYSLAFEPRDAYESAVFHSNEYDIILVSGSLYLVGDIRRYIYDDL